MDTTSPLLLPLGKLEGLPGRQKNPSEPQGKPPVIMHEVQLEYLDGSSYLVSHSLECFHGF